MWAKRDSRDENEKQWVGEVENGGEAERDGEGCGRRWRWGGAVTTAVRAWWWLRRGDGAQRVARVLGEREGRRKLRMGSLRESGRKKKENKGCGSV